MNTRRDVVARYVPGLIIIMVAVAYCSYHVKVGVEPAALPMTSVKMAEVTKTQRVLRVEQLHSQVMAEIRVVAKQGNYEVKLTNMPRPDQPTVVIAAVMKKLRAQGYEVSTQYDYRGTDHTSYNIFVSWGTKESVKLE